MLSGGLHTRGKPYPADAQNIAFCVAVNGVLAGIVAVADPVRPTTAAAIKTLHAQAPRVIMANGDNERTARAMAGPLGFDEVRVSH